MRHSVSAEIFCGRCRGSGGDGWEANNVGIHGLEISCAVVECTENLAAASRRIRGCLPQKCRKGSCLMSVLNVPRRHVSTFRWTAAGASVRYHRPPGAHRDGEWRITHADETTERRARTDRGRLAFESPHVLFRRILRPRAHVGFRTLRVINDDRVMPGQGFGAHGHRDMEIISIVLEGGLAHKDSLENGATLSPGEVQVMSAGRGIRHSEFNASRTESVHFLQVWITPDKQGVAPRWGSRRPSRRRRARIRFCASQEEAGGRRRSAGDSSGRGRLLDDRDARCERAA